MTTREYILQQAIHQYEVIERNFLETQKCIVDLSNYTRKNRANILFNHIYFSELDAPYRSAILTDKNYLKIIDHRNYNPRLVQLMTEVVRMREISPDNYVSFFLQNLGSPSAIWKHAFENHLSQSSRNLLIVLMSMPYAVFLNDLRVAFQRYTAVYAQRYGASISPQDFRFALRELEGTFLTYDNQKDDTVVTYHNPSVKDFIKQYLAESPDELRMLILSIVYFEQLKATWNMDRMRVIFGTLDGGDSQILHDNVRQVINAGSCSLINVRRGKLVQRERTSMASSEEKACLLASMVQNEVNLLVPVLEELLLRVLSNAKKMTGDREHLAELLDLVLESSMSLNRKLRTTLVEHGKKFLLSSGWSAEDLSPLCDLMRKRPEIFTPADKQIAHVSLKETLNVIELNKDEFESEALREQANAFESIASQLGADIASDIAGAATFCQELGGTREFQVPDTRGA